MLDTKLPIGMMSLERSVPPTAKLAFNDTSPDTFNLLFKDTSPRTTRVESNEVIPTVCSAPLISMSLPIDKLAFKDTSPALTTEPVKDGDARGALRARAELNPVLFMAPPTYRLAFIDTSDATCKPAFKDTSPADTTEPVNDGDARGALSASAELNPVLFIAPPT